MKYYVYAIKSLKNGMIYVGISHDPQKRLIDHNRGKTRSTKSYRPWVLIYQRESGTRIMARKEEKKLKSGSGKEFLKSLNQNIIPR